LLTLRVELSEKCALEVCVEVVVYDGVGVLEWLKVCVANILGVPEIVIDLGVLETDLDLLADVLSVEIGFSVIVKEEFVIMESLCVLVGTSRSTVFVPSLGNKVVLNV
jgi:hypothetical protein